MITGKKRLIVLAAPSGAGKTTIARHLLKQLPRLRFSISATTRPKRKKETYGIDYYFLSREDFEQRIARGDLIEYEEIFGNYYGTLRTEIDKAISLGDNLLFDIDVKGALSIRRAYPDDSLLLFIAPPSMEVLEQRLRMRATESEDQLKLRLQRAGMEMAEKDKFDYILVNDNLSDTLVKAVEIVSAHFQGIL